MKYDIAIIGAGSAGLTVAATAAQFGQKVVLFEKHDMGGDCLNTGCVPSKALLAAAKAAHAHRTSAAFGISAHEPNVDFAAVMAHVEKVIATIEPNDNQARFEGLGVKVVRAAAKFISPQTIEADGQTFSARRIVVATGSRAGVPPIPGLESVNYLTNETIFKNRVLPSHLIVIGGGPIGMEMAQAHRRLGAQVTVLEAFDPLAKDDPELTAIVLDALRAEGIQIRGQAKIENIEKTSSGVRVNLQGGEAISGSHILVAAGRLPNIENLNLEAAGVAYTKRGITVDPYLRSSNPHIYAAGDVAGGLQFTHVAGYHGGLIIRSALFKLRAKNRTDIIPWVTYTDPELAHVGHTETSARTIHGNAIKVLRWHFNENDRALAEGKSKGLVKVVATSRGKIIGASIVGAGAGELIALWALAITKGLKLSDIASMVLPYPTLNEASKRAAITSYAGLAQKPIIRWVIGALKIFG